MEHNHDGETLYWRGQRLVQGKLYKTRKTMDACEGAEPLHPGPNFGNPTHTLLAPALVMMLDSIFDEEKCDHDDEHQTYTHAYVKVLCDEEVLWLHEVELDLIYEQFQEISPTTTTNRRNAK